MILTPKYTVTVCHFSGLVGQSWAIVFSTAGYHVRIHDNDEKRLDAGMQSILSKMKSLEDNGCLRGTLNASKAFALIKAVTSLEECVTGATYVQVT